MKIAARQLLKIDRWFYPLNKLLRQRDFSSTRKNETGRVVVIKLMGLGSIIRLVSLCRERQVDFSRVVLITFASNREACKLLGLDEPLIIRTGSIIHFIGDCFTIVAAIRQMKPDWIIDFERCSNAVSVFRQCLAFVSGASSLAFDDLEPNQGSRHILLSINQYSFHEMLLEGIKRMPMAKPSVDAEAQPIRDSTKVVVNINCSEYLLARRYPRDLFREVIEGLNVCTERATFYLTGAASERAYVEELASVLTRSGVRVHNVAGEWTLKQLQEVLLTSGLFISGDSGPLHLAIHLGVPTLAIWGPTRPQHFGYTDNEFLANVGEGLPCAPCFLHPRSIAALSCGGRISCMHDLTPGTIIRSAEKLLQRSAAINILAPAASW